MANNEFHSHPQVIWPRLLVFLIVKEMLRFFLFCRYEYLLDGEREARHKALVFGVRLKEVTSPFTFSESEGGLNHCSQMV